MPDEQLTHTATAGHMLLMQVMWTGSDYLTTEGVPFLFGRLVRHFNKRQLLLCSVAKV